MTHLILYIFENFLTYNLMRFDLGNKHFLPEIEGENFAREIEVASLPVIHTTRKTRTCETKFGKIAC